MPRKRSFRPDSLTAAAITVLLQSFVALVLPTSVSAQRPYFSHDALYRDETARREYADGYAVSGALVYQPVDLPNLGNSNSLGIMFRLDYQLAKQFDVSAIVDASGGDRSQSLGLSWLAVKHLWHSDGADMAVRIAFEPRPPVGGGIGFRQTDVAFFYSKVLSPSVETEIALGGRHVRTGFQVHEELDAISGLVETRGYEAHIVLSYNMVFDPARSHVSVAFGFEAGRYDVAERILPPALPEPGSTDEFAGHVLWIRTGLHWYRPSYQLVPFVSFPLSAGKRGDGFVHGTGPRFFNVGFRVTLL